MLLGQRDIPSNVSNRLSIEIWEKSVHIKAIGLSRGDAVGQAVLGAVGVVSCLIVVGLLLWLLSYVVHPGGGARKERATSIRRFLLTDMGVYFLCLLVADLGMPLSASGNLSWARLFVIRHSSLCNFQGATNQLGVISAAYFNLCITVQTFLLLFVRYTPPSWVKWVVAPLGIVFSLLMTVIGPAMNKAPFSFYGPNSSGCWITFGASNYQEWLSAASYLSISVLAIMLVLYVLLFLSLSGALAKITNREFSSFGNHSSSGNNNSGGKSSDPLPSSVKRGREVRKVARKMLWFPLSYGLLSIPLVVCCLLGANGILTKHVVYIVSNILYILISIGDVLIFALTRNHLLRGAAPSSSHHHHGGISMQVVTTTYNSPPNPDGSSATAGVQSLPYVRPLSPVDSLEDEIEEWKKESGKQGRRTSRVERVAWSEGHEDSVGLVVGVGRMEPGEGLRKIDSLEESRSSKVTLA